MNQTKVHDFGKVELISLTDRVVLPNTKDGRQHMHEFLDLAIDQFDTPTNNGDVVQIILIFKPEAEGLVAKYEVMQIQPKEESKWTKLK